MHSPHAPASATRRARRATRCGTRPWPLRVFRTNPLTPVASAPPHAQLNFFLDHRPPLCLFLPPCVAPPSFFAISIDRPPPPPASPSPHPSDDIPTAYYFTVQVRAVVRGLAAAQGIRTTLLPAVESLPASRLRIDSYPGVVYRAANATAVRVDATRAAAARARAQTDAIAAGLGARVGRLNFASLNADAEDGRRSGGGDSSRSVFRASVRTEYYVL